MHPRIPLAVPDLRGRESELLQSCIRDNWVSSAGPDVGRLEHELASLTGRAHAVATVSGTAALHLMLVSLGIGSGDTVIVPDWTFAATANAVAHAGAVPFFVDIGLGDWAIDPELVARAIEAHPVKAVIAVDPVGHAADFDRLAPFCLERGLILIEDAAGAIGATFGDRMCGSFGRASIFSFNGNKTVTAGGGGAILTDDAELAARARHIGSTARLGTEYVHDRVGWNYRLPNVNAAIALAQIERLADMVGAKRVIAGRYARALAGRGDIQPAPQPVRGLSSAWLYCVRVASPSDAKSLVAHLDKDRIDARVFWRSLSAQAPWSGCGQLLTGVSAALSGTVVSLPSSSSLTDADQQRVIASLATWTGSNIGKIDA